MPNIQRFYHPEDIWDHIDIAMVRNREEYINRSANVTLEKIQLGAGFKHIEGWRNLEYPEWNADCHIPAPGARHRVALVSPFADSSSATQNPESVSEIASYHTLDHLSPNQVVATLREIERVLVPGGTFTNIVPHYSSQLANECIHHKTRFAIDTWRNIFSERQYAHDGNWRLRVGLNFIFGLTERNTVLVTQLVKE